MKSIMDPQKLGASAQTVVYGMTETSPVTFGCDLDAPIVNRCETVGRVYPHVHAKIVHPDDVEGKPLPIGEPGELCVSCRKRATLTKPMLTRLRSGSDLISHEPSKSYAYRRPAM